MTVGSSMVKKHKILYLYLTLACFFGIIAIFILDGYIGVYDTVFVTSGEYEEKIEADYWNRTDSFWSTGVNQGEKTVFRYEVDNRLFSNYATDIQVSVWHGQEKVRDIISAPLSVGAFDKVELEWTVNTEEIVPEDIPAEQSYQFTVIITRAEIERKVIVHVNPNLYPIKPVPVPSR